MAGAKQAVTPALEQAEQILAQYDSGEMLALAPVQNAHEDLTAALEAFREQIIEPVSYTHLGDTEVTTADTPPVYLAFACGEDLSGLEDIVQTLTEEGITAVFLFRTEELAGQAEQIRQAVGSGQTIGLIVSGISAQEVGQAVDEGNDILADIAWTRARAVSYTHLV